MTNRDLISLLLGSLLLIAYSNFLWNWSIKQQLSLKEKTLEDLENPGIRFKKKNQFHWLLFSPPLIMFSCILFRSSFTTLSCLNKRRIRIHIAQHMSRPTHVRLKWSSWDFSSACLHLRSGSAENMRHALPQAQSHQRLTAVQPASLLTEIMDFYNLHKGAVRWIFYLINMNIYSTVCKCVHHCWLCSHWEWYVRPLNHIINRECIKVCIILEKTSFTFNKKYYFDPETLVGKCQSLGDKDTIYQLLPCIIHMDTLPGNVRFFFPNWLNISYLLVHI